MGTILLATEKPFAAEAVEKIRTVVTGGGHQLALLENYTEKQQLLNAVADADALIVRSDIVDADVINAGNHLKIVVRAGAGYDNLDLKSASANNVVCMNTPGQNANAVAECAFGMMLFMARKQFSGSSGTELRGKNLGIVGYGNIGRYMAQIGRGFGMDVYAYKRNMDRLAMEIDGVTPASSFEDVFEHCQYISLHLPSTAETKGVINYHLLRLMPKGAMLVNTARVDVVNEDDLLKLMEERSDIQYVSDFIPKQESVFKEKFAKRIFYPAKKMGAQTEEANVNAGIAAAKQILDFLDKGIDTFRVN
ncbi:MAG TPA: NAD(P)-dependent oxidoreductase [Chitinophagales bacterium]|nr:3-phosphoglycerate dehydrogenase [Chitinophagales bacterium]HMZ89213.1 NAD(P)-dependent oxidoreductase [Chitinophagales bacterium]HNI53893.1 NAD(P)-dependent oxidoreductase [Chitinophagales bacterium]HNK96958.1 NAD(P)-dependent oxidoreductase [Chitinophagales bacterium]HNM08830.1 NAD(P)-dependent oxidoreductase [Chitinophagales bacterium]